MKFIVRLFNIGICLASLLVTGCDDTLAGKWKYNEARRLQFPDGVVEAIVIEGDGGATTSKQTCVYIAKKGGSVSPAN
jgi:hypothetical protein